MDVKGLLSTRRKATMNIAVVYILIAVLASGAGQLLLKKGMLTVGEITLSIGDLWSTLWRIGTTPYIVIGLVVFITGTVFWLAALSRVDLSFAYPFASLGYIIMLIASWQIFDENISILRLVGTLIIGFGVFLISRS